MIESLSIIIALLAGIGIGYWVSGKLRSAEPAWSSDDVQNELSQLKREREQLQIEKGKLEERV